MRRALVVAVVILAVSVVADFVARGAAEDKLRQRAARAVRSGGQVAPAPAPSPAPAPAQPEVRIRSFPFLARLLVAGQVERVEATVRDVKVRDLRLASISVVLEDVRVERDPLISDRKLILRSIGRGTGIAEITDDELTRLLGVPVELEDGRASATVLGRRVGAEASVAGGVLRLTVEGFDLPPIELPRIPFLPCASDVAVTPGRLRLTCTLTKVPAELAGRRAEVQL